MILGDTLDYHVEEHDNVTYISDELRSAIELSYYLTEKECDRLRQWQNGLECTVRQKEDQSEQVYKHRTTQLFKQQQALEERGRILQHKEGEVERIYEQRAAQLLSQQQALKKHERAQRLKEQQSELVSKQHAAQQHQNLRDQRSALSKQELDLSVQRDEFDRYVKQQQSMMKESIQAVKLAARTVRDANTTSALNNLSRQISAIEDALECSICRLLFTDPVTTKLCGHVFCSACIERWLSTDGGNSRTCPECRCDLYKAISTSPLSFTEDSSYSAIDAIDMEDSHENEAFDDQESEMASSYNSGGDVNFHLAKAISSTSYRPNYQINKILEILRSIRQGMQMETD